MNHVTSFTYHHTALSVLDIERSIEFYSYLGFSEIHRYEAPDSSLRISHMKLGQAILELFCFADATTLEGPPTTTGNNLTLVGIKHIALQVKSIVEARDHLTRIGLADSPEIEQGRTGIEYFFIQDPDGMWVEIVQDDRSLSN